MKARLALLALFAAMPLAASEWQKIPGGAQATFETTATIVDFVADADRVVLLVADGDRRWLEIHRFDASAVARRELAGDAFSLLALDLDGDGDGRAEPILAASGRLEAIEPDGLRPVLRDPDLAEGVRELPPSGTRFCTGVVGALRCFAPAADRQLEPTLELPLPIELRRRPEAITLDSPALLPSSGDADTLVTAPRAFGERRLRVDHLDLGAGQVGERWIELPTPELVLESWPLMLAGRPLLMVTTRPSGDASVFGEKLLRLFPLAPDPSRAGRPPIFAVASEMNLWQAANFAFEDVDGDGRADLVFGYFKGIKDAILTLDAYLQSSAGGFAPKPKSSSLRFDDADRTVLELDHDFDGDGIRDALIGTGWNLEIHRGVRSKGMKSFIEAAAFSTPRAKERTTGAMNITFGSDSVSFGQSPQPISVRDFEGDGRPEIVQLEAKRLIVYSFTLSSTRP